MDPIQSIIDFFTRLVRSRVNQATSHAKSKMNSAQAKAKMQASKAFNDAVDGGIDRAKGAADKRKPSAPAREGQEHDGPEADGQS